MINKDQLKKHIIQPALKTLVMQSDAAVNLLLGTCAQESAMGHYLRQINGPALGIYQIEPATHRDLYDNYLKHRPHMLNKLRLINIKSEQALIGDLNYSTAVARLIYYRCPDPLPEANDVVGLAKYWKKNYNTYQGKGTVDEFCANYRKYVE